MMVAPTSRNSSGETLLTVAWVPTGIKMGVWMMPCCVEIVPARAHVSGHFASIVNENGGMSSSKATYRLLPEFSHKCQGLRSTHKVGVQRAAALCRGVGGVPHRRQLKHLNNRIPKRDHVPQPEACEN